MFLPLAPPWPALSPASGGRPKEAVGVWLPLSGPYLSPLSSMTRSRPEGHACLQRASAILVTCGNLGMSSCFLTKERTPAISQPCAPTPSVWHEPGEGSTITHWNSNTDNSCRQKYIDEFPFRKAPPPSLPPSPLPSCGAVRTDTRAHRQGLSQMQPQNCHYPHHSHHADMVSPWIPREVCILGFMLKPTFSLFQENAVKTATLFQSSICWASDTSWQTVGCSV